MHVTVGGVALNPEQTLAVWAALKDFLDRAANGDLREILGARVADGYVARMREVFSLWYAHSGEKEPLIKSA